MNTGSDNNAFEVLTTLTNALGAGLAVWGVINLLEGYKNAAAKEEIAFEYRSRIAEIDLLAQRVSDDYAADKIPYARYQALCVEYDAEQAELTQALYGLDAATEAQKRQGMTQLLQGAGIATIAPLLRSLDNLPFAAEMADTISERNAAALDRYAAAE